MYPHRYISKQHSWHIDIHTTLFVPLHWNQLLNFTTNLLCSRNSELFQFLHSVHPLFREYIFGMQWFLTIGNLQKTCDRIISTILQELLSWRDHYFCINSNIPWFVSSNHDFEYCSFDSGTAVRMYLSYRVSRTLSKITTNLCEARIIRTAWIKAIWIKHSTRSVHSAVNHALFTFLKCHLISFELRRFVSSIPCKRAVPQNFGKYSVLHF